ncbi:MAG: helix-turn-helix domain-containing protein, partial [Planctomycetes bacterium]|nr:helix-turn-helix domain-containing protein [Planctomycetota bacterium]
MSGEVYSSFDVRIRAVLAVERGWAVGDAADAFGITRRTLH